MVGQWESEAAVGASLWWCKPDILSGLSDHVTLCFSLNREPDGPYPRPSLLALMHDAN